MWWKIDGESLKMNENQQTAIFAYIGISAIIITSFVKFGFLSHTMYLPQQVIFVVGVIGLLLIGIHYEIKYRKEKVKN